MTKNFQFDLRLDWTCTVDKWDIITNLWQLYNYCRSQKAVIILPLTTSTVVIQLPQIRYYAPFNHCVGLIWVQNQKFWSKPGLWWRSVVIISKNKKMVQQCGFQKIWKILLLGCLFKQITKPLTSNKHLSLLYFC